MLGLIRKFAQWPWPLVRSVEEQVSNVWAQFRRGSTVNENEVTEVNLRLGSTTTFIDGKIYTPTAGTSTFQIYTTKVDLNTDFTIECKFNFSSLSGGGGGQILGQWAEYTSEVNTSNSWQLYAYATGQLTFIASKNGQGTNTAANSIDVRTSTGIWSFNKDHHVAVTRKGNLITLWLDGVAQASVILNATDTFVISQLTVRNFWNTSGSTYFPIGYLYDIRIAKECFYDAPFTPAPLPPYVRPAYSLALAAKIVAQYGLRRNSLEDEAGNGVGKLFGTAAVSNGRITQTNVTTSYFQLPIKKFGAGDFTIELNLRVSAVHTSYGAVVLGHWKAGSETSDDNRWCIWVGPTGQVSFQLARSATAGDRVALISVANKILFNVDHHVVVERIGQRVTIYVDGVSAVSDEGFDFAVRGEAPFYARSLSAQNAYAMAGSVWNIRISDTALYKGNVVEKPTFPSFVQPFVWPTFQLTKAGASSYDEVTGHAPRFAGNATIVDGTITTAGSTASRAEFGAIHFDDNEDFTIECKWNASSIHANGNSIIGVWETAGSLNNSWDILLSPYGNLLFCFSVDGKAYVILNGTITVSLNADNHVAVVRKSGVIQMYVNGVAEAATLSQSGASFKSTRPLSTARTTQGYLTGARWDLRIVKGRAEYSAAFTPKPLVPFYRPTYTKTQQENILHQLTFREDLNLDEITGVSPAVNLSNTVITRGRIIATNSASSYYSIPVRYFGAADFTMECRFRLTAAPVTHVDLMSHWHNGTVTNTNNRYRVRVLQDRRIQVIFANSSAANDYTSRLSTVTVDINRDYHLAIERVNGVITVYLDGASVMSWSQPAALWATEGNFIEGYSRGTTGYGPREVTNIRIASKALYNGAIPFRSTFPQTLNTVGMSGTSAVQVLAAAPKNKILSDQSTQTTVQVLEKKAPNRILSDQSTQTIIQILVKK